MSNLQLESFRVLNYRSVEDSGPIRADDVTCLVGRNEAGKSTLLQALHRLNPADNVQAEGLSDFPRHRFSAEFSKQDWPFIEATFEFGGDALTEVKEQLGKSKKPPKHVTITKHYSGKRYYQFSPNVSEASVSGADAIAALQETEKVLRRLAPVGKSPEEATAIKKPGLAIVTTCIETFRPHPELHTVDGVKALQGAVTNLGEQINENTKDAIEPALNALEALLADAQQPCPRDRLIAIVEKHLPVSIYFSDYGVLDSAVYLPEFQQRLATEPTNERLRTTNALFRHVGLTAKEVLDLGAEQAEKGADVAAILGDSARKRERHIKLDSASKWMTQKFSEWYREQRKHNFRYQADGNYFRIWVSDSKRPDEIEFELRSHGFQWFFSFYLVFLVESGDGHKDAMLLLDEPGLHLHPTAQQELISFINDLSKKNQIVYTTHLPFLIDGENLHRVRPVVDDEHGVTRVSDDTCWPRDRDAVFPLQAALGYSMMQTLFMGKNNLLVEGLTDYWYLKAISAQLGVHGKTSLREDVFVTPCGGTRNIGYLAALFLGQDQRPVVLLDGDAAGRSKGKELAERLFADATDRVLLLDQLLGTPNATIEDLLTADLLADAVNAACKPRPKLKLSAADKSAGGVLQQVAACVKRQKSEVPDNWKILAALHLVTKWSNGGAVIPDDVLARAENVCREVNQRVQDPTTS